jgi:hypothetical protein
MLFGNGAGRGGSRCDAGVGNVAGCCDWEELPLVPSV